MSAPRDVLQVDGTARAAPSRVKLDELEGWIAELRGRVARGELDDLGPIPLDGAAVLGSVTFVRIMLADLDHYDVLPPALRHDLLVEARRRTLLGEFARLREHIDSAGPG